jgi:hypothetical protein
VSGSTASDADGSSPRPARQVGSAEPAKAKPPAPEDQPFAPFVSDLLLPALAQEIGRYGGPSCALRFEQGPMPVVGEPCWMVMGELPGERRFWLCFSQEQISSPKTIALSEGGGEPSLLESFLIDEKKTTLALLVSRLVQRLNGQKWLGAN